MNKEFKEEFKNLNIDEIKELVNRCAGTEILGPKAPDGRSNCFVKHIDDDSYGFWDIEWGLKTVHRGDIFLGEHFQYRIKATPFRVDFENTSNSTYNPNFKTNDKKHFEEYFYLYINRKCKHYKQAIIEETDKFIKFLGISNEEEKTL